ncbi:MAG: molybdopterin-dependent oxidoreductase [Candidatus Cloacimonetes bacterium]|nr:molybdopterin-dependent oxidoreductase [Candidatus Cloacimonadota bacterium]
MTQTLITIMLLLPLMAIATVFELTDADTSALREGEGVQVTTEREKHGKLVSETWTGLPIDEFLATRVDEDWKQVVITSPDGYQVAIPVDVADEPILAWNRDGEPLPELRVVWPGMREMHWVRGPTRFETRDTEPMPAPRVIYLSAGLRRQTPLRPTLPPFPDVTGYHLADLAQHVFPTLAGEFLLVSRDGVSHTLDWNDYLDEAALVAGGDSLHLRSVSMPGGMWLRDLAWMQCGNRALLMLERFDTWHDVARLLGWSEAPTAIETLHLNGDVRQTNLTPPGDAAWTDVTRFTWLR